MDDTGVVSGLMEARPGLLLHDNELETGARFKHEICQSKADDARAHNRRVKMLARQNTLSAGFPKRNIDALKKVADTKFFDLSS